VFISSQQRAQCADAFTNWPKLTPTERRLGATLLRYLNAETGRCDPSEERLATDLGVTDRAIRLAKRGLRSRGLLRWESYGGKYHSSSYLIDITKLVEWHGLWREDRKKARDVAIKEWVSLRALCVIRRESVRLPGTNVPSYEVRRITAPAPVTDPNPENSGRPPGTEVPSQPGTGIPTNSPTVFSQELSQHLCRSNSRTEPKQRSNSSTIWALIQGSLDQEALIEKLMTIPNAEASANALARKGDAEAAVAYLRSLCQAA
jgi:hypothetical protein